MKFNNWSLDELISYLQLAKCGTDHTCVTRVFGEIHIYNGERKDGREDMKVF